MARLRDINARINFDSNADEVASDINQSFSTSGVQGINAMQAAGVAAAAAIGQAFEEVLNQVNERIRRISEEVRSLSLLGAEDTPETRDAINALQRAGITTGTAIQAVDFTSGTGQESNRLFNFTIANAIDAGADPREISQAVAATGINPNNTQAVQDLLNISFDAASNIPGLDYGSFLGELASQGSTLTGLGLSSGQSVALLEDLFASGVEVAPFQSVIESITDSARREGVDPLLYAQSLFSQIRNLPANEANQLAEEQGVDLQYVSAIRSGQIGFGYQLDTQYGRTPLSTIEGDAGVAFDQTVDDSLVASTVFGLPVIGGIARGISEGAYNLTGGAPSIIVTGNTVYNVEGTVVDPQGLIDIQTQNNATEIDNGTSQGHRVNWPTATD